MVTWSFELTMIDFCDAETKEEAYRKIQRFLKNFGKITLEQFMESDVSVWEQH